MRRITDRLARLEGGLPRASAADSAAAFGVLAAELERIAGRIVERKATSEDHARLGWYAQAA
jgi:hypothetical protein